MRVFVIITFILLQSQYGHSNETCHHDSSTFRCVKFIKNYDGDTITFDIPNTHPLLGKKISVRVLGVDTPEIKTKNKCEKARAIEAKKIVEAALKKAKRIDLENIQRDKYFRILADVKLDGISLSQLLLTGGFAYSYTGGTKELPNWCKPLRTISSENKNRKDRSRESN